MKNTLESFVNVCSISVATLVLIYNGLHFHGRSHFSMELVPSHSPMQHIADALPHHTHTHTQLHGTSCFMQMCLIIYKQVQSKVTRQYHITDIILHLIRKQNCRGRGGNNSQITLVNNFASTVASGWVFYVLLQCPVKQGWTQDPEIHGELVDGRSQDQFPLSFSHCQ